MADLTHRAFQAATQRGEIELATKPRAKRAFYDPAADRLVIDLASGASYSIPPRLLQGLETASAEQIAAVEILGSGFGLHWEDLDADFSVEGLLAGRFGTARYMVQRFGGGWDAHAAE